MNNLPVTQGIRPWPAGLPHSPLGGSCMERRIACPGSLALELPYYLRGEVGDEEDTDSTGGEPEIDDTAHDQREQGIKNHLMAARVLRGEQIETLMQQEDPEYQRVQWYVGKCLEIVRQAEKVAPGKCKIIVEEPVNLSGIHPAMEVGTIDFAVYVPGAWAWIADMKNCYSQVTEAPRNVQLGTYALGAVDTWGVQRVKVSIFNPVKLWESHYVHEPGALEPLRAKLRQAVDACLSPWAPCMPGEKQCQYCKAYTHCPAILAQTGIPTEMPIERDLQTMPREELCRLWRRAQQTDVQILLEFIGQLEQKIHALVAAGADLSQYGIAIKAGKKSRVFASGVRLETLQELGRKLGKPIGELMTVPRPKMVTVAGLESQWGTARAVREAMASIVVEVPGKVRPVVIPDYTPAEGRG